MARSPTAYGLTRDVRDSDFHRDLLLFPCSACYFRPFSRFPADIPADFAFRRPPLQGFTGPAAGISRIARALSNYENKLRFHELERAA
jgi:hypothetical protein